MDEQDHNDRSLAQEIGNIRGRPFCYTVIYSIINRKRTPDAGTLWEIAQALKINMEEFFKPIPKP